MLEDLPIDAVHDPEARRIIGVLLNLVEGQAAQIAALRVEVRGLRDEVARLQGEPG